MPNPGAGRVVDVTAWLRTITSTFLKTPASNICVFAAGGIISSPGVPNTTTFPGSFARSRYSPIAIATAIPIGPCVLC